MDLSSVPDDGDPEGEASDCEIDVGGPTGTPSSLQQQPGSGGGHGTGHGPGHEHGPDKADSLYVLNQYLQHQHHYGPRIIR